MRFAASIDEVRHECRDQNIVSALYIYASNKLCKIDKMRALGYYFMARMMSDSMTLNKQTDKVLFPTERTRERFEAILAEYRLNSNMAEVQKGLVNLYEPERRKVMIEQQELEKREQQFRDTVELLDSLIAEDTETSDSPINFLTEDNIITSDEVIASNNSETKGDGKDVVTWTDAENALLNAFAQSDAGLDESQIESIARQYGVMKFMLIDAVNEKSIEKCEIPLIVEEDGIYVLDGDASGELLKKYYETKS